MASYPGSIFSPRAVANRAGVVYDADKTKVFFAKDHNDFGSEIVAIQNVLGIDFDKTFREVSKEGLVLAMNFNSESIDGSAGSEKVLDSSGHNNHGTNSGATHDDDGGFNDGGAFDFDGGSNEITIPASASLDIGDQLTVSAWVKSDDVSALKAIFGKIYFGAPASECFGLYTQDGKFKFKCSNGTIDVKLVSDSSVTTDWIHVVGTYNGAITRLYINGVEEDSKDLTGNVVNNTAVACYLANIVTGGYRFNGLIDEPRIYTRALSADEIRNLYMARKEIHNSFVSQKDIYVDKDGKPAIQNDILNIKTAKTPATAGATGVAGDICWDASYIYVCVATNTWKRVAIATW